MDSQVRKRKNKGGDTRQVIGKEKDLQDLTSKLGNIINTRRDGGDGESVPETPPNEMSLDNLKPVSVDKSKTSTRKSAKSKKGFSMQLEIDGMAVGLFVIGVITRFFMLENPNNVVFDEMHYGKYAAHYLKNTFFFDSNPPLGKLIIALAGYVANWDGMFNFDKIGVEYSSSVPLFVLRFVPAMAGSLLVPLSYLSLQEMGLSAWTGVFAAFMIIFDNAILTQSRFILMESIMMCFGMSALLATLKFKKVSSHPFSGQWFFWLCSATLLSAAAFSVKYIGIYTAMLCWFLILQDFWRLLPDKYMSDKQLFLDYLVRVTVMAVGTIGFYLAVFYLHFEILYKAGTHDNLMTSQFQASLEGGLGSIIRGQPSQIVHGSQITLRHTYGRTCWLHSHEALYPVKYEDGRGSSHQQQVSCYTFKDINNWWIIKRPDREALVVSEPLDTIKHGDEIQIVHGLTHRALNSHDVAAPMSPNNQEVSCYIDYNISMPAENHWRVDIINRDVAGDVWHTINSQVRLIHVNTSQALKFSGKQYPEWGFEQLEVAADRNINQADTVWNVEEHQYTKDDKDKETIEKEIHNHELIPESRTDLSFWMKFLEVQFKMLLTNQENVKNHNFASDPSEWPFMTRGIAYYIAKDSNNQVHLLGNIVIWYTGSVCAVLYTALLLIYLLRRRRQCYDISEEDFKEYCNVGEVLLTGYLLHYVPYFFFDRTLFLHHYLTAYIFKMMLASYFITHTYKNLRRAAPSMVSKVVCMTVLMVWVSSVVYIFKTFSVLSYANKPLSAEQVRSLRWKDTWDLIIHKK